MSAPSATLSARSIPASPASKTSPCAASAGPTPKAADRELAPVQPRPVPPAAAAARGLRFPDGGDGGPGAVGAPAGEAAQLQELSRQLPQDARAGGGDAAPSNRPTGTAQSTAGGQRRGAASAAAPVCRA